jgi:hypothetical protein
VRTIATITFIGACLAAVLTTGGCDGSTSPQSPDAPAGEQSAQQWTMPDLVGATLQDAQDQIQALTAGAVYFTDSHDLSGAQRNQVVDANWQVCTQNVEPGQQLTTESQIDFGVVKLEESCP